MKNYIYFANRSVTLLVIFCVCINCETNRVQEKVEQHIKDSTSNSLHAETETLQKNEEYLMELKKKEICDNENDGDCNTEFTIDSKSVNEETTIAVEGEQTESQRRDTNRDATLADKKDAETSENVKSSDLNEQDLTEMTNGDSVPTLMVNDEVISEDAQIIDNDAHTNKTYVESNSTFYQWMKFILEPFIEEFKDGIYPKLSDKPNNTLSNVSFANDNVTEDNIDTANVTVLEPTNVTESENNTTDSGKKVKFQCIGRNISDSLNATVKLITTAQLLLLLNFEKNETENATDCLLVMFYAPWCHFCAKIAPHYNALARAFPQLDFVAVDTAQFSNLLARFGTVSVPNILVFHQSRAAVKFNQTDRTFENFVTFVTNSTGLDANMTVNVTEADFLGPVPSVPTDEPDYLLVISWLFVIFCSSIMFVKSNKGQQWINRVRVLWQEHQHID